MLDLDTGQPAALGEPGTIVATPFPPFRETTVLLCYDTRDVVRQIPGPFARSLSNLPVVTTDLLGKLSLSVRHESGWTFPRDVLEALEAVEEVPLPVRCGFWPAPGGIAVVVVTRRGDGLVARRAIGDRLEAGGVPLQELHLRQRPNELLHPLPLRCDLRETSFQSRPPVVDHTTGHLGPAQLAVRT